MFLGCIINVVKVVEITYGLPKGVTNSFTPLFTSIDAQVTRNLHLNTINASFDATAVPLSDVTSRKVDIWAFKISNNLRMIQFLFCKDKKYPLCRYILGMLTHTTAWDRHCTGR